MSAPHQLMEKIKKTPNCKFPYSTKKFQCHSLFICRFFGGFWMLAQPLINCNFMCSLTVLSYVNQSLCFALQIVIKSFLFTFSSYFFMNKRCFLKPSLLQFYLSIYQFSLPTILCRRSLGRAHSFQYNHENSTSMDILLGISLPIIDECFLLNNPNEDFHNAEYVIYTTSWRSLQMERELHFHFFNIRNL